MLANRCHKTKRGPPDDPRGNYQKFNILKMNFRTHLYSYLSGEKYIKYGSVWKHENYLTKRWQSVIYSNLFGGSH